MKDKYYERWYSIPENRDKANERKRERSAYIRKRAKEWIAKNPDGVV